MGKRGENGERGEVLSEVRLKGQPSWSSWEHKPIQPPPTTPAPLAAAGEEPWGRRQLPVQQCQAPFMWIHNNNNFTRELACLSRLCQVYVPDGPCLPHLIYWRADQLRLSPGQAHIWQPVGKISPHDIRALKSYSPEQFSFYLSRFFYVFLFLPYF